MRIDSDSYPRLHHLLAGLYPGCEQGTIDQDVMPEAVARRWSAEEADAFRDEARRAVEVVEGMDVDAGIRWLGLQIPFPGGHSVHTWLRDLADHIEDYHRAGAPLVSSTDGVNLPRVSAFHGQRQAEAAADAVIAAYAETFRAWAADAGSPWRLHLYADLGEEIGYHLRQDEVEAYKRAPATTARPANHPSTGCVVLWRKHPETREPYVAVAYPEISLDAEARGRFPDLPLLFGGYFGQDYSDLDHDRWTAERNLNLSITPELRERLSHQLELLLGQDDAALRRDVEALGSYVLPRALRRWVTGLHRRMTRIDWSRP